MNLYFWLFALYALLITPVGAQMQVRVDQGVHYRIRIRAAGLPLLRKKKEEDHREEIKVSSRDMMRGMSNWDAGLLLNLVRQGHVLRIFRLFDWRDFEVRARVSFQDAAQTAMVYALIRTVLQSAAQVRPLPVRGRVEMDFHGSGTTVSVGCIADTRLGKLLPAVIRLWLAVFRHRAKQRKLEEEQHAAASH